MRLKNNWYNVALGTTASAISVIYDLYIILILYFIWLLYLFFFCHVKLSLLFLSMMALVCFHFYLHPPSPPTDTASLSTVNLQGNAKYASVQSYHKIELI